MMKKENTKKKPPIAILTPQDKVFADKFIETGVIKTAAAIAYPNEKWAAQRGSNALQKDPVRDYIQQAAMPAMTRIVKLSEKSRNEAVRLAANKDILDRAGYKPQEAQVNINMPFYLPAEVMDKYNLAPNPDNDTNQQ